MSKLWKKYFDKGLDSAKNGQLESSIAYFERSAKLNPLNSEIVYNLGTAYLTLGMPEDAIKSFSEAIKLLPALFLNKIGNNLPGSYKTSFLGHKMHRFADRLGSVKEDNDLYFSLISEWEDPEKVVLNSREPKSLLKDKSLWPKLNSFEEKMMYLDTMTYLPDDILAKVDRAAMGVSLETRVPFLDHRVVELSARIPLEHKIKKGKGKQILRKILDKHVPQHLIERPKQGFGIPLEDWLRGPLRDWSEDLMNESKLKREGFFNPSVIRTRWKEHLLEKRNWEHSLWSILMFQSWLDSQ